MLPYWLSKNFPGESVAERHFRKKKKSWPKAQQCEYADVFQGEELSNWESFSRSNKKLLQSWMVRIG